MGWTSLTDAIKVLIGAANCTRVPAIIKQNAATSAFQQRRDEACRIGRAWLGHPR
jgi:hypothetical protein